MFRSLFLALMLVAGPAAADTRLIMFDQAGCSWCEAWDAQIGPVYGKTEEGRAAPLVRYGMKDALPSDVSLASPPVFTPTFVLLHDGQEVGRIEGYPGEDFFWGLLGQMIDKLPDETAPEPGT